MTTFGCSHFSNKISKHIHCPHAVVNPHVLSGIFVTCMITFITQYALSYDCMTFKTSYASSFERFNESTI